MKCNRTSLTIFTLQEGERDRRNFRKEILFTCQPTPRLSMDGGKGVALAYLATAIKAPVD